jgi:hypothetical protein
MNSSGSEEEAKTIILQLALMVMNKAFSIEPLVLRQYIEKERSCFLPATSFPFLFT